MVLHDIMTFAPNNIVGVKYSEKATLEVYIYYV